MNKCIRQLQNLMLIERIAPKMGKISRIFFLSLLILGDLYGSSSEEDIPAPTDKKFFCHTQLPSQNEATRKFFHSDLLEARHSKPEKNEISGVNMRGGEGRPYTCSQSLEELLKEN